MNRLCSILLVATVAALALAPVGVGANSGFIAYAPPWEQITVDGSLEDWPQGVPSYPLESVYKGSSSYDAEDPDSTDLRARFRAVWSPTAQRVYVALIVHDDRLALGDGVTSTDVCELYVDADRSSGLGEPQQFLMFPGDASYNIFGTSRNPTLSGGDVDATGVVGSWGVAGDSILYEWALPLLLERGQPLLLQPGTRIGVDVVAVDKDAGQRPPTWLSWSPGPGKVANPESIGELVLLPSMEEAEDLPYISGRVVQPGSGEAWRGIAIRAQRDGEDLGATVSGPDGIFHIRVTAGPVRLEAVDADPPAAVDVECRARTTTEVTLDVIGLHRERLPVWPFAVSLGLFAVAAALGLWILGQHLDLVGGVLVRPASAFEQLSREPELMAPAGIALATAAVSAMGQINLVPGQLWGTLLSMPGALATGLMITVPIMLFVAHLVTGFGGWLAWAACLWAAARLSGLKCRYFHVASIVGYAGLPLLLGACTAALANAWGWQDVSPALSRVTGLGLWVESGAPLGEVLARVELFTIWTCGLGTVGAARLLRITWRRAAALNAGCWVLYLLSIFAFHAVSRALATRLAEVVL
jgi:hypothetical protein